MGFAGRPIGRSANKNQQRTYELYETEIQLENGQSRKYDQPEARHPGWRITFFLHHQRSDYSNPMNNFQLANPWRVLCKCRRLFVQDNVEE